MGQVLSEDFVIQELRLHFARGTKAKSEFSCISVLTSGFHKTLVASSPQNFFAHFKGLMQQSSAL